MWLAYFLIIYLLALALFFYNKGRHVYYIQENGVVNRRQKDKAFLLLSFLLLTFLACFRGPYIGTDTINYVELFDDINIDPSLVFRFEPGFMLYVRLLNCISDSPQIMIITSSLFIMYSFYLFIKKYSCCVWLSVFLFFSLFFNASLNIMRQYIAIAFLLYSFDYVIRREKIKFLLLLLIAFLFHFPSIIFIIAYPLYNYSITKQRMKLFWYSLPVIILVSMSFAVLLFSVLRNYGLFYYYSENTKYIEEGFKVASLLLLLFYLVLMSLPIKAWKIMRGDGSVNLSPVNRVCLVFGLISIVLLASSFSFNLIDRFVHYFAVYICILLPNAIYKLSAMKRLIHIIILVLLLSSYYITISTLRPEWSCIYPYEFY